MAETGAKKKGAGLFDIRNFIGLLLLAYGAILTVLGIFADQALDKTGGINANLFTGLGLLVVGGFFVTWARLKPVVVEEPADAGAQPPHGH